MAPRHLQLLNDRLIRLARREIRRLAVFMPPRHGKSEFISKYFVAWYLGMFPSHRVILASYEADFARSWGRKARDLMQDYGADLFGVRVRSDSNAADRWDIVGTMGGMNTAGAGGPITGKGAHLLIIDDPIKDAEEAKSETRRRQLKDWWMSTARTRLEPGGVVVLVQTRWHEDDLGGWLLSKDAALAAQPEDNEIERHPWVTLSFTALAEADEPPFPEGLGRTKGEALWPERYGRGELLALQTDPETAYWWDALYQQRPQPPSGGILKREWFKWFEETDTEYVLHRGPGERIGYPKASCWKFATNDLAVSLKQTADYTVCASFAVTPEMDLLLLDLDRARLEGPDQVPMLHNAYVKHGLSYIKIERAGYQLALVQQAIREGLPALELETKGDKVGRALTLAARSKAGKVFFPLPARVWMVDLEKEWVGFPLAAHDDIIDTLAYGAIEIAQMAIPQVR